ncbi:GerMN domain-containing protein [Anaerotignum sp.]
MAKGKNFFRKAIILIIALIILIPCSVLFYDAAIASGEEKVDFYYMMTDGKMKPFEKKIRSESKEDTLVTVLNTLKEEPKTDGATHSIPESIEILFAKLDGSTAIVDFSDEYYRLSNLDEVICRSSVVWTLTSLDFVDNVEFWVEGQPLRDHNGEATAAFNRGNVVIDSEISAETTEYAILTLYFANAEGTDLAIEERVVEVNANQTREKTILEQLIGGPTEKDCVRTIPTETKIRDVTTTSDGTCYVNLSEDFVVKHSGGKKEELLTVYSIVNSLCELDYVDKVQFLIEGKKLDEFKGNLQFKTPFTAISSLKTAEVQ